MESIKLRSRRRLKFLRLRIIIASRVDSAERILTRRGHDEFGHVRMNTLSDVESGRARIGSRELVFVVAEKLETTMLACQRVLALHSELAETILFTRVASAWGGLFAWIRPEDSGPRGMRCRLLDAARELLWQDGENMMQPNLCALDMTLSKQERTVCAKLLEGLTLREISESMGIAYKTVDHYRSRIYEKLGLHNRAGLARWAYRTGFAT